MRIQIIVFDLDGVLIDTKKLHYETLNDAIYNVAGSQFIISWTEHVRAYDGLKTVEKLERLTERRHLPRHLHQRIWEEKQQRTLQRLQGVQRDDRLCDVFQQLVQDGYRIGCCTNSIRKSVDTILTKLGIIEYFDVIVSNEDVERSKPYPDIYWEAMRKLGGVPQQTIVLEDSPYGLMAAHRSHAHILRIATLLDVTYNNIKREISEIEMKMSTMSDTPRWKNNKLNVLIPMAGAGSRFEVAGYTHPKPLIDVRGNPMIQLVVENVHMDAHYIFLVQKSHRETFDVDCILQSIAPNSKIVEVDGLTEGAACTALLAANLIDNDQPLFLANSDQYVEWDSNTFMYKMQETDVDGGIAVFHSTHPKWSFAKTDESGFVTQVAEKNPISDLATVGFYYWKHGSDFVKYAKQMIRKDIRVNNEFYICPIFNEAIEDGKKISVFEVERMWGLGTPDDLTYFLEHFPLTNG